jgi:hypothetical protein
VGLVEVLRQVRARGGDLRLHGSSPGLDHARLEAHLGRVARIYPDRQHAVNGGANLEGARGGRGTSVGSRLLRRLVSVAWMRG